ncbi:MAG TPA: dienelactone hydrolase family protein [Acidimicrobiales bacterium]|nr:dienelactone hydrolase family protein [Acidimicrobiales bacterium]
MSTTASSPGFPVYVTGSTGSPRALIVLQEAFGVNHHIRNVADRFADAGFFAVAPHLFHRSGAPEIPYDEFDRAMPLMAELTVEGLTNDLNATIDFLNSLGFGSSSIGVVGFCMGGSVAFYAATLAGVGAAVTFYGGGLTKGRFGLSPLLELAPTLRAPWLGLFGDLDTSIPSDDVEALRVVTAKLPLTTDIVRYPDAQHGFHCDARPSAYNEGAARDAYRRTLDFFAEQLSDR